MRFDLQREFPRKAGWRPRVEFLEHLARDHPKIRLVFVSPQWRLVQLEQQAGGGGEVRLLSSVGARPSELTIERKLNEMRGRVRMTLGQLTEELRSWEQNELAWRSALTPFAEAKIGEGSDRLASALRRGSTVSFAGSNG